jgi:hypothetical protein
MARIITDSQITELLAVRKPVPGRLLKNLKHRLRPVNRSMVADTTIRSDDGRTFVIAGRRSAVDVCRFSIRLSVYWARRWINLIRCNGLHGEHRNLLEMRSGDGVPVVPKDTFHVHYATERYQLFDKDAEYYAEPTDEYYSYEGAVEYLCQNFGCYEVEHPGQKRLF